VGQKSARILSGDRRAFQNGSARTRSNADAAHMRKASGIMRCVRRGKYRSMKMRVLETEQISSPNVNITACIQLRDQTALSKAFVGLHPRGVERVGLVGRRNWDVKQKRWVQKGVGG